MFDYQKAHSSGFDLEELGVTQSKGEPQPKLDCKHWKEDCNHKHLGYKLYSCCCPGTPGSCQMKIDVPR
jgi:hypothetical protein